jgi:hypothetical protein
MNRLFRLMVTLCNRLDYALRYRRWAWVISSHPNNEAEAIRIELIRITDKRIAARKRSNRAWLKRIQSTAERIIRKECD